MTDTSAALRAALHPARARRRRSFSTTRRWRGSTRALHPAVEEAPLADAAGRPGGRADAGSSARRRDRRLGGQDGAAGDAGPRAAGASSRRRRA